MSRSKAFGPKNPVPALVYENPEDEPLLCKLLLDSSREENSLTLFLVFDILDANSREAEISFQYDPDELAPGTIKLTNAQISLPTSRLEALARQGQCNIRTLCLTPRTQCHVWWSKSLCSIRPASGQEPRLCQLGALARAKEVNIVFDYNALKSERLNRMQRLIANESLIGIGVHSTNPNYVRASLTIFDEEEASECPPIYTRSSEHGTCQLLPSCESSAKQPPCDGPEPRAAIAKVSALNSHSTTLGPIAPHTSTPQLEVQKLESYVPVSVGMQTDPTGFPSQLSDLYQKLSQSCEEYIDQKFDQREETFRKQVATVLEIESSRAFDAADQLARDTEEQLKHIFYEAHQDIIDDLQAERGISEKSIEKLVSSLVVKAKRNIRKNARKERESLKGTFETLIKKLGEHRERTVRQNQAIQDETSDIHVVCEDAVADSDTTTEDEEPPWKRRRLNFPTGPSCDVATSLKKEELSAQKAASLVRCRDCSCTRNDDLDEDRTVAGLHSTDSSSLGGKEAPSPRFPSQVRQQSQLADNTPWWQNRNARAGSAPP
ncbi:hypothetical protein E8E12_000639 [Didymella heteroderae]|uniref:Uncharacterized protein n=1 Tax=Didymella heteroderae TaxID=1769908 RepID=A0A9P5BUE9_9PLEO|nr:hypothetical protein E8E12_000639 [Didymella heteroderae]